MATSSMSLQAALSKEFVQKFFQVYYDIKQHFRSNDHCKMQGDSSRIS